MLRLYTCMVANTFSVDASPLHMYGCQHIFGRCFALRHVEEMMPNEDHSKKKISFSHDQNLLLVATTNQGKLKEFRELLADLPCRVISLSEAGIDVDVEETGST